VFFRTAVAPGTPRTAGADGLTRIGAATIGVDGATFLFTCALVLLTAIVVGAVGSVLLAISFDLIFVGTERVLTPWSRTRRARPVR